MKSAKWMFGGALALCLVSGQHAMAQGNSQGHGKVVDFVHVELF
jgi:hypothetical protein